jgi:hypothetical protein
MNSQRVVYVCFLPKVRLIKSIITQGGAVLWYTAKQEQVLCSTDETSAPFGLTLIGVSIAIKAVPGKFDSESEM